jgi:hypothetical protein
MPLSTGTNIILRGGQDPDALAYFSRAGIASGTQTPTAYDNAASFTSASSQSLTSTAANLQCQSQSFTVAGWFFMPSNAPAYSALITQGSHPVNAGGGFTLQRFDNLNLVYLTIRNDNASNSVSVNSSAFVPSTWNFVECGWDSTLNQSFISINGGTRNFSTAVAGWTFPNTTNITRLGRDPFGSFLTGNLAGWGLWKRVLTSGTNSEIAALFNSGAGRTYASLDTGLRNNLISWWALNGTSTAVSLTDSHTGGNNLTNTGSVTAPNIGPIITGYSDSRRLISDFVRGIKSLGLWNSMVCWPLRSSQNASTTLTARSLGGLGTYDAPMTGLGTASAAWGTNGVNISGSGCLETLSTPLTTSNSIRSQLAVWNNTGGGTIIPMSSASLGAVRFALRSNNATNACIDSFDGTSNDGFGSQTVPAGFNQSAATYNFASGLFTFNANRGTQTTATRAITFSSGNITMGGWQPSNTGGGSFVLPFALVANVEMSLNNLNAVNNLYRQTLGIGLNLP